MMKLNVRVSWWPHDTRYTDKIQVEWICGNSEDRAPGQVRDLLCQFRTRPGRP